MQAARPLVALRAFRLRAAVAHRSLSLPPGAHSIPSLARRLGGLARPLHSSAAAEAKILAADPIEKVCGTVLAARKHELVALDKTPTPAALIAMIGDYEGLIVRRCARRRRLAPHLPARAARARPCPLVPHLSSSRPALFRPAALSRCAAARR